MNSAARRFSPVSSTGFSPSEDAVNDMVLSLTLLGEFALRDGNGDALSLPTRKTRALLAFLALNAGRPQRRERLMALLWSDRSEQQARQSLNQALRAIRKLGEKQGIAILESDSEHVTLRGDTLESDIHRFQSLLDEAPAEAADLYTGLLLDGLSIAEPAFEDWRAATRAEMHALACNALARAADDAAEAGKIETAINRAARLVSLDPLREEAHRRLMRLMHESGDRAAALRQYRSLAELLEKELQVEPDAATKALYDEIRQGSTVTTATTSPSASWDASPPLSGKPSIAVLPFDNLSRDPAVDHLADGLMEDLITALAKVRELLVIDRHSTETYKGLSANVQDIAATLGVRYILEGSIRTHGGRLRCSVQLIDTKTGHHLWAERYDKLIEDIFALQDEIVWHILVELQVRLTEGDGARIASRGTRNLQAWLLRVEGAIELAKFTREGIVRARDSFEAAHRADPNWARPIAGIAYTHYYEARYGWSPSRKQSIEIGLENARSAVTMDPNEAFGYQALRSLNLLLGNYDEALKFAKMSASLAPNDMLAVGTLAVTLMFMDEPAEALETFERAMSLTPNVPRFYLRWYGFALHLAGDTERAISVLEELTRNEPDWADGLTQLAAVYETAGRHEDAKNVVATILKRDRGYTASRYLALTHFANKDRTDWMQGLLISAGLPV